MDLEIGYLDMLRSNIAFSTLLDIYFPPLSMSNIGGNVLFKSYGLGVLVVRRLGGLRV